MKNYPITSIFIGILLDDKPFLNLFVKLNEYILKNRLVDDIIMQDIHSLHLTLFYLTKYFISSENESNLLLLKKIDKSLQKIKLSIISSNYFYNEERGTICYLESNNKNKLLKINKLLDSNLSAYSTQDNLYDFVPHITLLKIKNNLKFRGRHKKSIERLINNYINKMQNKNLFKSTNIFLVNSSIEPERQLPIRIVDLRLL